jgi:hypothetical protein
LDGYAAVGKARDMSTSTIQPVGQLVAGSSVRRYYDLPAER